MTAIHWLRAVACALLISGCTDSEVAKRSAARRAAAAADTGYAAVQTRGRVAMGVDQYTSTHRFELLPDGGRIELQRDLSDGAGRSRILAHMGRIAEAFAAGDFRLPGFVHAHEVPGTDVMAAERGKISYEVESLPRGGAVRLRSSHSAAVEAIHEFLVFQQTDHHAGSPQGQQHPAGSERR